MSYQYFSRNGEILPVAAATIPLDNAAYSYGFGVYETIRISGGIIYFLDKHLERLMGSANILSLTHHFTPGVITENTQRLIDKNEAVACNLKILLVGGQTPQDATLYMMCLNPLFPDRKLYRDGAAATTYSYERDFPQAKSLNMLPSYLAYREAREAGAYDALLINRAGNITEGTRTNFFAIKDSTIFSPPEAEILPGVTREAVLGVAAKNGFQVIHQAIPLDSLDQYDGAFLTSTSSKIMPLRTIGNHAYGPPTAPLRALSQAFNQFLSSYEAV